MTWAQTIERASHWVGFILPGIIEEPGSLAGNINSAIPLLGPEDKTRISFAILNKVEVRISKPLITSMKTSCEDKDSNLLGAVLKENLVNFLKWFANNFPKFLCAFIPDPTAAVSYTHLTAADE